MVPRLDGGETDRAEPFLGNASPPFITVAAVVRRELGLEGEDLFFHRLGGKIALGDGFQNAVGSLPEEFDGGGLLLVFKMLQLDLVGATSE